MTVKEGAIIGLVRGLVSGVVWASLVLALLSKVLNSLTLLDSEFERASGGIWEMLRDGTDAV